MTHHFHYCSSIMNLEVRLCKSSNDILFFFRMCLLCISIWILELTCQIYIYIFLFVVDFVIHWNETAMGLHVFPIPIPPPTSLSTRSLYVYQIYIFKRPLELWLKLLWFYRSFRRFLFSFNCISHVHILRLISKCFISLIVHRNKIIIYIYLIFFSFKKKHAGFNL